MSQSDMAPKRTKADLTSTEDYIQMLNGFFELTDTEIEVLSHFINAKRGIERRGLDWHPFSPRMKKVVAKRIRPDCEDHYWLNTYIKALKEKGALHPEQKAGLYSIHPLLIPGNEDQIVINLNWSRNGIPDE